MTDELTPVCCGCGGEAKVQRVRTLKSHVLVVMCTKCEIATNYYATEAEAIEAWNRAMGAKDINVPGKGFGKPVYASEATGFDPSLAGCDPVFNHVCSICGQEPLADDLGEEYLSYFCPHCGADMRHEDIPMEYFENGGI